MYGRASRAAASATSTSTGPGAGADRDGDPSVGDGVGVGWTARAGAPPLDDPLAPRPGDIPARAAIAESTRASCAASAARADGSGRARRASTPRTASPTAVTIARKRRA